MVYKCKAKRAAKKLAQAQALDARGERPLLMIVPRGFEGEFLPPMRKSKPIKRLPELGIEASDWIKEG